MSETSSQNNFWKQKLAAFLHDPPSKCVNIQLHEEEVKTLYRQAGFTDGEEKTLSEEYAKQSDWVSSAADRFPFPVSRGNISSVFDGVRAQFHHPLSVDQPFKFHQEFQSTAMAWEVEQPLQPDAQEIDRLPLNEQWRARFFIHWRLWEKFCIEKDYRFAFLPAETRLPDHSVWTHMQITSALDSCAEGKKGKDAVLKPAFLKLQLGPVQEFIAEARSIRDLWSGSYLLSWLMAAGLKALAMEIGPDAVIFPNLKGQPIFDLHLKKELWGQIKVNEKLIWEHLKHPKEDLLTPNLPNVFLAVVPQNRAEELAKLVEQSIRNEWENISKNVWEFCEAADMISGEEAGFTAVERKARFDKQVKQFLSISWQTTPWPNNLDEAIALADSFDADMPIQKASERVKTIIQYATQTMPKDDRDGRYYIDGNHGDKTKLNNIGLAWSVILAFNSWQLDAVRQTRVFEAENEGAWKVGTFFNKDSLGGKAEAVAGGREWVQKAQEKGDVWKALFKLKHEDWVGASTLIKRLWHVAYLAKEWKLQTSPHNFPMPNTYGIAKHEPFSNDDRDDKERTSDEKYFAILALDGDEIGKWISGEKTPIFAKQFSDYKDGTGDQKQGAVEYFQRKNGEVLLNSRRALSPSYHLQFSQALSNFALLCARPIVEAHDGRLIYAGGDDVLAILPADTALACATDLREAFQGRAVEKAEIASPAPGYLSVAEDYNKHPIAFVVPGKDVEVSVGIAIAHFKSPLQDVVRAAQAAEKRAKRNLKDNGLGRGALAISIYKRSGEILEWGTRWVTQENHQSISKETAGLQLFRMLVKALITKQINIRFPHKLEMLLQPYRLDYTIEHALFIENFSEILENELDYCVTRNEGNRLSSEERQIFLDYWNETGLIISGVSYSFNQRLTLFLNLLRTAAWTARGRSEVAE